MNNRIQMIRDAERQYHESCYDQHRLFEPGSWLSKPVKTVMDTLDYFHAAQMLHVLDLGCGVGRNSIPIAESLKHRSGSVMCVDLLESALNKLHQYSDHYGVGDYVQTCQSDIGDYVIPESAFDLIIAVSALEHLESERKLQQVLERMARGTKSSGMNCIIMGTNIQEFDLSSGAALEPLMELNLPTAEAEALLSGVYADWNIRYTTVKALEFHIERNNAPILLKSDCITYVVQRNEHSPEAELD